MNTGYSPTVTSFYTEAENPRTHRSMVSAGSRFRPQLEPARTTTAFLDKTSYLCLRSKLVQSIVNRLTLLFALLAVYTQLLTVIMLYMVQAAKSFLVLTCADISDGSTTAGSLKRRDSSDVTSLSEVWTALNVIESAIDVANVQCLATVNVTLQNTQQFSNLYVTLLSDSYEQLSRSLSSGALTSAENATSSIGSWLDSSISTAASSVQSEISSVTSALASLQSSLQSDSSLFSTVELGSGSNISLTPFTSIKVPAGVGSGLSILAATTDFGFADISTNATAQLTKLFQIFNTDQVLANLGSALSSNSSTAPSSTSSSACPSSASIATFFGAVVTQISQLRVTYIAVFAVLAVVAAIAGASYEFFAYVILRKECKVLATPGSFSDPMQHISNAANPIATFVSLRLAAFSVVESHRTSLEWISSFALSSNALFVLLSSACLMVMYLSSQSFVRVLSTAADTPITVATSFSANYSVESWVSDVNSDISSMQTDANKQMGTFLVSAVNGVFGVLQAYEQQMAAQLQTVFTTSAVASTNLSQALPASGVISSSIPLKSLAIADIIYPTLNVSNIVSSEPTTLSLPIGDNQIVTLTSLVQMFDGITKVQLQLSLSLLGVWLALTFGAITYQGVTSYMSH